jgi:pilus assembly protein FimV
MATRVGVTADCAADAVEGGRARHALHALQKPGTWTGLRAAVRMATRRCIAERAAAGRGPLGAAAARRYGRAAGAGVLAFLCSAQASALGLGELQLQSFLNEPLDAQVELLDLRELTVDDIRVRLAGVDDFDRLGVERSYFLTSIQFEIDTDEGVIRLMTEEPVLEPYLDLIIEARWPTGRLLREYTVLVDPPAFRTERVTVSASERVRELEQRDAPEPEPEPEPARRPDGVALRESDLAPGEMPERAFSAQTSSTPAPGSRYMVRRDETLWQIASAGKPAGVAVQQAMLDIQRLNPEAFIDGNINRIKAGYIIYLPDAGEISSDDLARALDEVRAQNRAFESRSVTPGVTAAATLRVSAEEAPADDEPTDAGISGATATPPTLEPMPDAAEARVTGVADTPPGTEAPAATGAVDAQMAAQLQEMAERLDTLEQIVALKDEQIATLEQALREAREATPVTPVPAPQPAPSERAAQPAQPESPRPAAVEKSSGGVPLLPLIGGFIVLVALGVLAFLRRRRNAAPVASPAAAGSADDVFAGVNLQKEALDDVARSAPAAGVTSAAQAPTEDTEDDDVDAAPEDSSAAPAGSVSAGGSRGYGERKHDDYIDDAATGDALAEADIYIAYGRYLQAIELLEGAIDSEPQNSAYRLKLIELYVDMGEDAQAAQQLEKLRAGGDAAAISRAEELFSGGTPADTASPSDALFGQDSPDEPGLELDAPVAVDDRPETPAAADSHLDATGVETAGLELEPVEESDPLHLQSPPADEGAVPEFEGLEIEEAETPPAAGDDVFSLDEESEELDFSDALESEAPGAAPHGDDDEELLIAEDADQLATKLDLARAYLDMGDSDGARVILEEVVASGNAELQREARELLERIA